MSNKKELNHYWDNANYYLKKHGVLFYNIPKVASSTLWSFCAQIIFDFEAKQEQEVRQFKIPSLTISTLNQYPEIKKIAFVRNPFDRLVSVYKNKIEQPYKQFITFNGLSDTTAFPDFVHYVCSKKDAESDKHFRSQFTFLSNIEGKLMLDELGRFETFAEDLKTIVTKYELPMPTISHWNKSTTNHYALYYTPELIQLVKKRYALDLALFGYEFNQPLEKNKANNWNKPLPIDKQLQVATYKSQKLLRVVKHIEKYDDFPKGIKGLLMRKYKEYFTNYFD